jgi:glycerophosphoryl diester phosphodiesterase
MLASFDLDLMKGLGEEVKDIELGLILGTPSFDPRERWREAFPWRAFRSFNYQVLCMQVELCFGYLARGKAAAGKRLYVWTANTERQFAQMTALDVDGIVTNYPARLREFLQNPARG